MGVVTKIFDEAFSNSQHLEAAFFKRFPDRQHRVRRASGGEIFAFFFAAGDRLPSPSSRGFVAVGPVGKDRGYALFFAPASSEFDISEDAARTVFQWAQGMAPAASAMAAMNVGGRQ